jgi:hypothetical protein
MDGNVGIGGDPLRLLRRVRSLLGLSGQLIVETHPDPAAHDILDVRFWSGGEAVGPIFEWAHVGRLALVEYAEFAGYSVDSVWSSGGRSFVALAA